MSKSKTEFQIERIAFFSDAVFAIAITLLIIEIHAPVFSSEVTPIEAFSQILELIPEFVAVLASFFLISITWRRHHQLFRILTNYDENLITLNFFILASIIFLPFSTAFIAKNYLRSWFNPLVLPLIVYSLNNLACAAFNYLMFNYALNPQNELYTPDETFNASRIKLEVFFPIIVFTVITVMAFFSQFAALVCFALLAFEPLFIRLVFKGKNE